MRSEADIDKELVKSGISMAKISAYIRALSLFKQIPEADLMQYKLALEWVLNEQENEQ